MTLHSALTLPELQLPVGIPSDIPLIWLSELDASLRLQLGQDPPKTPPYTPETPLSTELFVPFPNDCLYRHYILAKAALLSCDYELYNRHTANYNDALNDFLNQENRNGTKKKPQRFHF